jgi:hypothetical protein
MSRAAESVNLEVRGVTVDFDYSNRLRAAIMREDIFTAEPKRVQNRITIRFKTFPTCVLCACAVHSEAVAQ